MATAPIGIFDSGMGGLTVVQAISKLLPNENLIYFGDTQHTPWGDKSPAAIKHYATNICDMLLAKGCKAIVIACSTASAVAAIEIEHIARHIPVLNVIDPVVDFVAQQFKHAKIGLIGTKQTVASNNYLQKLAIKNSSLQIQAVATPLLVPLIEEGMAKTKPLELILAMYLQEPVLAGIDALILGCTHYPLLKQQIEDFYNHSIPIIDATKLTADCLQQLLINNNLINHNSAAAKHVFYMSDDNQHFAKLAKIFFPGDIQLELLPLWDNL